MNTSLATAGMAITIDHPYLLDSIAQTASPGDVNEHDWHRYVIKQGDNCIVGYRRGTLQSVRDEVNEIITQLNARRSVKSGKPPLSTRTAK